MTDATEGAPTAMTGGGDGDRDDLPPTRTAGSDVAGRSHDTLAWVLAFLPLGTALLHSVADAIGLHPGVVSVAALAGSAALIVTDKRDLARTGRLPATAAPSTAWFLFPPGYLRRRARLLGEPGGRFWISLACMGLAFASRTAFLAGGAIEPTGTAEPTISAVSAPALPSCTDEANMQDVVDLFGKLKAMRDADVQGVVLTDRAEVPGGELEHPAVRLCAGRMRASNEEDYAINYMFEVVEGRLIVHVAFR